MKWFMSRGWLNWKPKNAPVDPSVKIRSPWQGVKLVEAEPLPADVKPEFRVPQVREIAAYYGIRRVDTGSWRAILQPSGEHDIFTTESREAAEEAIGLFTPRRDISNWRVDVLTGAELERQRTVLRLLERAGVR